MTLLKDHAWICYPLCWTEILPNIRRLTESGSWTVEMSLLVDHTYGKRKTGNLKTRKSEIKAYRWSYGNGHKSGLIYLSHVNAHQKVTTMESILNDQVYKIT